MSGTADLVPVRVSFSWGTSAFDECFCWEVDSSEEITKAFVAELCEEHSIPSISCADEIVSIVRKQVEAYKEAAAARPSAESARALRLDFVCAGKRIRDRMVWDISDTSETVELVARQSCQELGLGPEFVQAYSYHIRKAILDLWRSGQGSSTDLGACPAGSLIRYRGAVEAWTPKVAEASQEAANVPRLPAVPPTDVISAPGLKRKPGSRVPGQRPSREQQNAGAMATVLLHGTGGPS
mmetsp:Transcript_25676/g.61136  ORF Transcript_25676/g.61136 Transcript_25676/m.61136 type:complete len:239 (-) Transcript_25676:104-820(-)